MSLGKTLRQIRKDKGLKQVDVAKELETSQSYISQIENDQTIPTKRFLKLFCLQYGVDKDRLL
jgi:transcriptional regulator with XRE-family HTH domain